MMEMGMCKTPLSHFSLSSSSTPTALPRGACYLKHVAGSGLQRREGGQRRTALGERRRRRAADSWQPPNSTPPETAPETQTETERESGIPRVSLGKSGLIVPRLGVGTLQWGDPSSGFDSSYSLNDLLSAFRCLNSQGLNFFDTAEVYGYQGIKEGTSAEQLLGKFEKEDGSSPVIIGTKFFTIPWTNLLVGGGFRLGRQSLLDALRASLERMGRTKVDLYQIHFPFPTFSNAALMDGLAQAVEEGLTCAVGVSNYSTSEMREAHALLSQRGIPLASNQIQYSLIARDPEKNGVLKTSQELGISLLAYSPLASGLLSEKTLKNTSPSPKEKKVLPLLLALQSVGLSLGGKTVSQVALAYLMHKGVIPIPGCKNLSQAQSHADTASLSLNQSQAAHIDDAATNAGF